MEEGFSGYHNPSFLDESHNGLASSSSHQTSTSNFISSPQTPPPSYLSLAPKYYSQTEDHKSNPRLQSLGRLDNLGSVPAVPSHTGTGYSINNTNQDLLLNPNQFSDYRQNSYSEIYSNRNQGSKTNNPYHSPGTLHGPSDTSCNFPLAPIASGGITYPGQRKNGEQYLSEGSHGYNTYQAPYSEYDKRNIVSHGNINIDDQRRKLENDVMYGRDNSLPENRTHIFVNTDLNQEQEYADVFPVEVSFIDRKSGIEYFADGTQIPVTHSQTNDPIQSSQPDATQIPVPHSQTPDPNQSSESGEISRVNEQPYWSGQPYSVSQSQPYYQPYQTTHPWYVGQQSTAAVVVHQPGYVSQIDSTAAPQHVPNYVPLSIIVFLCFCWCLGLHSLNRAREANRLRDQGKYKEAAEKATMSLHTNILGIFLGIIIIGISVGIFVWRQKNGI